VLEFNGGVTDNYLHPARAGADHWNTLYPGVGQPRFRDEPGSPAQPRALIPANSGPRTRYDLGYYTHDVRRLGQPRTVTFDAASAAGVLKAAAAADAAAKPGSAGSKNPDVERYDAQGLRTAMTTNWAALGRSLRRAQPNHLPVPASEKNPLPEDLRARAALEKQGLFFGPASGAPRSKTMDSTSLRYGDAW